MTPAREVAYHGPVAAVAAPSPPAGGTMRDDRNETWWDSSPDEPQDDLDRDDWGEEDWEAFLARQDVLNAKYQELYETLLANPQRDEIIAHEMHWDLPELPPGTAPGDAAGGAEGLADEADGDLACIPAYCMARDYAQCFGDRLRAHLGARAASDDDAVLALQAAGEIPTRLANGHRLGYEGGYLHGNIACCRQALASLDASLDGLLALHERGILPSAEADRLAHRGQELGEAISERVEELRLRVWWR